MKPLHVYPVNDIYPHDLEGTSCACVPNVKVQDGEYLIVHNSWDMREELEILSAEQHGLRTTADRVTDNKETPSH